MAVTARPALEKSDYWTTIGRTGGTTKDGCQSDVARISKCAHFGRCDRRALVGLQSLREIGGLMGFSANVWPQTLHRLRGAT